MIKKAVFVKFPFTIFMILAGIDEAGRGPGAGPVIAAAAIVPKNFSDICPSEIQKNIKDSKKVAEKKREEVYEWIIQHFDFGIGECNAQEVDTMGIKKATHTAMQKAVEKLKTKPEKLLIDGNDNFHFEIENQCIIKGDEKELCISAASIIAKVWRDRKMQEYAKKFPQYSFEKNKGYLTKEHICAIEENGICEIHRKTYEPIPKILYQEKLF